MDSGAIFHCCLDVRGALKNMSDRELGFMFRDAATGRSLTAAEAKDVLLDHVAQGHKVIPCGPACDGFDYTGKGCPGHAKAEADHG